MALTYQQLLTAVPLVIRAGNVPNIVGEAGVGKSALVREVADRLQARLFTTVVSLSEKGDLAIPVPPLTSDSFVETQQYGRLANVQFGYSATLVQIIKHAEAHPDQPIIWFLDEFNRGPQAVQAELMNLVLQRQINSLTLPDQVHIVIAENPDSTMAGFENSDYGVATGDAAIKDRTVCLVMATSLTDWLAWAQQRVAGGRQRINPLVTAYLQTHPERLSEQPSYDHDLVPTPRAWERVSRNLDQLMHLPVDQQRALAPDLFSGDLGVEVGVSFAEYVQAHGHELTVEDLMAQPLTDFATLSEERQVTLLNQWVIDKSATLSDNQPAALFSRYLGQISPDGQYALARTIGDQESLLTAMYQAARNGADEVAHLYEQLAKIATREDH